MSESSSHAARDKSTTALHFLLSNNTKPADVYRFLLDLDTDDLIRTLTNAGVITKSPAQVRHELLRQARDQLNERPFFSKFPIQEADERITIKTYINELQSISKRFSAARDSTVPTSLKVQQVSSLQIELIRLQTSTIRRAGETTSFSDVRKYADAISRRLSDWQMKQQDDALSTLKSRNVTQKDKTFR